MRSSFLKSSIPNIGNNTLSYKIWASKSSKTVVPPIQISIRHIPVWRTYQIKDFPKTRIGPKLVEDFMQEITSEDDMKFLEFIQLQNKINRQANPTGRPTKKNRRNIDDFLGN